MASQNDRNLHKEFIDAFQVATRQMNPLYQEMNRDLEYYMGEHYSADEKKYLLDQRRNVLTFNKIRKIVNLLSGYQRAYRRAVRLSPTNVQNNTTATQLSDIVNYIFADNGGYEILSHVFTQGPLKTGFGLINIYHDLVDDPISGDLRLAYTPWTSFFIDPYFTKVDMSDCAYLGRRGWVTRPEAKAILPFARDLIDRVPRIGRDNIFPYLSRAINPMEKDLHKIDEFNQLDYREVKMLVDPETGRWREWPESGSEERLQLLLQAMPNLKVVNKQKKTIKTRIFFDDNLVYEGRDPLGIDDYNYVPFLGFYDHEYHDWGIKLQGVIRPLRDPQTEANRRRSKMLDMLDSQIHSGWIAEEDAVMNPGDLYQSGQGRVIWAKRNQGDRIHKLAGADIPQGMMQLSMQMDQDILDIGGINEDMLGQVVRGEERSNALLSESRRSQGLLTLHELFDNYWQSKREVSNKLVRAIQENYTSFKVQEITQQKPAPEFFEGRFSKYSVRLEEVPFTGTQKQLLFQQLFDLKNAGAPIPWNYILNKAPLDNKAELMQQIEQAEQQQQQAQQLQMQSAQLDMEKTAAETQTEQAESAEKYTSAQLNRARAISEVSNAQTYRDKVTQDSSLKIMEIAKEIADAEDEVADKDKRR